MTDTATKPKAKPAKLGAEKLMPEEQKRRFIEAAHAVRASEDEGEFDANLMRIAKASSENKVGRATGLVSAPQGGSVSQEGTGDIIARSIRRRCQ